MQFNGTSFDDIKWLKIEKTYPVENLGLKNLWYNPAGAQTKLLGHQLEPYTRKVKVRILGQSMSESATYRQELIRLLTTESLAVLKFPEEETYELAKLEAFGSDAYFFDMIEVELKFMCPYGCAFRDAVSFYASGANNVINVGGSIQTPPTFVFTPAVTTMGQIANVTTGKTITFSGQLITPDIVFDCEKRTAMQGLTSVRDKIHIESDFFMLSPGANIISVSGGSAIVNWKERWI